MYLTIILMKNNKGRYLSKIALSLFVLLGLTHVSFSQNNDSTKAVSRFGGTVTVTNKGISTIPNLTLGKPAAIFEMIAGKGKLSFEPQFRFALEGKPWSFLFWWRYQLLNNDKFQIKLGAHPAIAFKTVTISTEEGTQEIIKAQRYLAGDIYPSYSVARNISIGLYDLYSYCLEENVVKNTNLLAIRCNFSNIRLTDQFFMRLNTQIYYLVMDADDGYYFNATLTLARKNFPLTVSSLINKTIRTEIPLGEDFLWNVSLIYTFNNNYTKL
jgi:hypothetical protein